MERTYKTNNECPRCGQPEDFLHVLQCQDEEASNIWDTSIAKAIKVIQRNISHNAAFITEQHLRSWRENLPVDKRLYIPTELQPLFAKQSQLGWTAFCVGRVSTMWKHYTTALDSHNHPKRLVYALIHNYASPCGICGIIGTLFYMIRLVAY